MMHVHVDLAVLFLGYSDYSVYFCEVVALIWYNGRRVSVCVYSSVSVCSRSRYA